MPGERRLPASGRPGPAPEWPLTMRKPTVVQSAVWLELWRKPQAILWAEQSLERVVARYVLKVIEAERPKAGASIVAEVRQMEDRLLLSSMALLRGRVYIVPDEEYGPEAGGAPAAGAPVASLDRYRKRLEGGASS